MRAFVAVFAVAMIAAAAAAQTPTIVPNTVNVGADGKFEASPDTALLQFNIAAQEDSAKAAYDRASRAAEQIRQMLRNNAIDPKQAEIGFYSLAPVYDYRTPKRKLVGYRVTSAVSVKVKDFTKVAAIVQQLSDIDVTENQSLSYTLDNPDTAKIQAVEDAFRRARSEADAVARAGGRTLGELYYGSVDVSDRLPIVQPMARVRSSVGTMATEAPPPPTAEFTPQRITVTAHVNAVFVLK